MSGRVCPCHACPVPSVQTGGTNRCGSPVGGGLVINPTVQMGRLRPRESGHLSANTRLAGGRPGTCVSGFGEPDRRGFACSVHWVVAWHQQGLSQNVLRYSAPPLIHTPVLPPFVSFTTGPWAASVVWGGAPRGLRATGCSWREWAGCWPGVEGGFQAGEGLSRALGRGTRVSGWGQGRGRAVR